MQSGKKDPKLYNSKRDDQGKKVIDYYNTYIENFLKEDPIQDGESFDRCKELGEFFISKIPEVRREGMVLDAGTKDGQFPQGLEDVGYSAIGIEIDDRYVEYAQSKERPVMKGDICNLEPGDAVFNVVFAHHVQGLCPDYSRSYLEMVKSTKPGGYIVTCNQVPGNPRKHFSLVNSGKVIESMISQVSHIYPVETLYFDYGQKGTGEREDELVVILRRK